ncbi:hypothetical protein IQ07DRAFT_632913 [Pyrenochaeta sp. DS3sAY3a]|nr:hypothetical protein IQ07DRAFT_632913 [Pyrenochaeta sp. DS3sAY3a]
MDSAYLALVQRSQQKNIVIVLLGFSTVVLALSMYISHRETHAQASVFSTRNYAEVLKPLNLRSSFVSSNVSIRNSHWDAFDHERGWIALPHSEAREQNLPLGLNLPDDNSKGLFILNAYHQMHCLTIIRTSLYALLDGEKAPEREIHLRHCLDFLRLAIECTADDTPLSAAHMDGSLRPCRSWSKMDEWADEHQSCWRKERDVWVRKKVCEGDV